MKFKLLRYAYKQQPQRSAGDYRAGFGVLYFFVSPVCKHDKEKAQHKAIPVIKPVGLLKTVPDKIEGADEKAHNEKHYECR